MRIYAAKLKRLQTADGLCAMRENAVLGTAYYVDLDRVFPMMWTHPGSDAIAVRVSVWVEFSSNGSGGEWLPVEFFDLPIALAQKKGDVAMQAAADV